MWSRPVWLSSNFSPWLADQEAGVRLGEHFRESGLLPGVMRQLPRPPVGLEELLVPVHAGLEICDSQADVVHPCNSRAIWNVHIVDPNKALVPGSERPPGPLALSSARHELISGFERVYSSFPYLYSSPQSAAAMR
jgi:hypothetical protein